MGALGILAVLMGTLIFFMAILGVCALVTSARAEGKAAKAIADALEKAGERRGI